MSKADKMDYYWTSSEASDSLAPGATHTWRAFPWEVDDINSITACPFNSIGSNYQFYREDNLLAVENVRSEENSHGATLIFTVRNNGQIMINGYEISLLQIGNGSGQAPVEPVLEICSQ